MVNTQTPVITARQWKQHKSHILTLYVDKNWPLRLVRQELAEAKGFKPSESQYRTHFKEWKIHKNRKSKIAKKIPTTKSDEPKKKSSAAAQEPPRSLCQRTDPLQPTSPFDNQEAAYPYLTVAADRIENENDNTDDWDPTGPFEPQEAAYPYFAGAPGRIDNDDNNDTLHAQAYHVGPMPAGNQSSLVMGWGELDGYLDQYEE